MVALAVLLLSAGPWECLPRTEPSPWRVLPAAQQSASPWEVLPQSRPVPPAPEWEGNGCVDGVCPQRAVVRQHVSGGAQRWKPFSRSRVRRK